MSLLAQPLFPVATVAAQVPHLTPDVPGMQRAATVGTARRDTREPHAAGTSSGAALGRHLPGFGILGRVLGPSRLFL
jgi:hypothetical protein